MGEDNLFTVTTEQILEQALRSREGQLVESVLKQTRSEEIPALINSITPSLCPHFLATFARYLREYPNQLKDAIPWIDQFVTMKRDEIAASPDCKAAINELNLLLKQRTQQMSLVTEVDALIRLVRMENDGKGVGYAVYEDNGQFLVEPSGKVVRSDEI